MDILKSFLIYRRRFFFEIFIAYRAYWFCELLFVQKMGLGGKGNFPNFEQFEPKQAARTWIKWDCYFKNSKSVNRETTKTELLKWIAIFFRNTRI